MVKPYWLYYYSIASWFYTKLFIPCIEVVIRIAYMDIPIDQCITVITSCYESQFKFLASVIEYAFGVGFFDSDVKYETLFTFFIKEK